MSTAVDHLMTVMEQAVTNRPQSSGFPYLAEILRRAGVTRNLWSLPACQSLFLTKHGPVVMQGTPLVNGAAEVPAFNQDSLVEAVRSDQAGKSTFSEFLEASWRAGVIRYEVNFARRTVTYFGCKGEKYSESYPSIEIA